MLDKLSKIYEIIVFTASQKPYADKIIDFINNKQKCIHHRLYRENCVRYSNSIYLKDLRIVDRNLKNCIIVDNSPYAFASQLDNGYPIIPFYDCQEDEEMKNLTEYLLKIQSVEDVRVENRKKFKLKELTDFHIGKYIQYYKPGNSDIGNPDAPGDTQDGTPKINDKIKTALNNLQSDMDDLYKDIK